jgi:hypothetical protein
MTGAAGTYGTASAVYRDVRRLLGLENLHKFSDGPTEALRSGTVAVSESPIACEQCGELDQHFFVVNDHISYPWILRHKRLECHDCHAQNFGGVSA